MSKIIVLVVAVIGVIAIFIFGDPGNELSLVYHDGELTVRTMDENLKSEGALTTPPKTTPRHGRSKTNYEETL